ncbi:50S ribosomal protein L17 [Candidatus Campbellbacteria bacterium CG10_big_fil_rev_8_21_14_0_10_35_52]|uniref:Large ribosomal subunit protein bL17 n=1 Tax=Candidatus Campbellbacteria bacterium CG10_big_fil_rev_8_21_14_0_10_35_52 TaxID=1974527 RepID=A0A2M6WVF7_9BACT|nr:MAG: 50S ribosomal protein L17 [Candidatus Campbellbacteria bacterium CG10_big_fil_rev_8_21_14_0_10_35_52]
MRHHNKNKKFGRVTKQRKALLRSISRSLILHGKIKTTETKAKTLRSFVEKLISKSKTDTLASRRIISSRLGGNSVATVKLFDTLAPKYKERNGGYTRITKIKTRTGDAGKEVIIEFV